MTQTEHLTYYLFPATLFVTKEPYLISTILGSCVSVCLWDHELKYGGINHFMLPLWNGKGLASPKFGNIAIKKLYEKMLEIGCNKDNIIAKVFGGGEILQTTNYQFSIGERNIDIAKESLRELNIPISGISVGGINGRKIIFDTKIGSVSMRYIENSNKNN